MKITFDTSAKDLNSFKCSDYFLRKNGRLLGNESQKAGCVFFVYIRSNAISEGRIIPHYAEERFVRPQLQGLQESVRSIPSACAEVSFITDLSDIEELGDSKVDQAIKTIVPIIARILKPVDRPE